MPKKNLNVIDLDAQPVSGVKYLRSIKGMDVDVYDVLEAFNVTCPAIAHAVKKLLLPGGRGKGPTDQDLREAIDALIRAIQLEQERT